MMNKYFTLIIHDIFFAIVTKYTLIILQILKYLTNVSNLGHIQVDRSSTFIFTCFVMLF